MSEASRQRFKTMQEGLGGIREILLGQSQGAFNHEFRDHGERYRKAQAINLFIAGAPRYVVEAAGIVIIAIVAIVISGRPSGFIEAIPIMGTLALGAQRLLPLLQQACTGWSQLAGNRDSLSPTDQTLERDRLH